MFARRSVKILLLTAFFMLILTSLALAGGDPSGASTGGAADITAATAGQPNFGLSCRSSR